MPRDGLERILELGLPLRAAEVREQDHRAAALGEVLQRRQRRTDARVVGHVPGSSSGTLKSTRTSAPLVRESR